MTRIFATILTIILFAGNTVTSNAQTQPTPKSVHGTITDAVTKEPIIGATVVIEDTTIGTATDVNGQYILSNTPKNEFRISVSYISYKSFTSAPITIRGNAAYQVDVALVEDASTLETVVVIGRHRVGSEAGILSQVKATPYVASGISASQIAKSNDRDASEVIKRVPGISIIDDRFIIVRGLSQRYNNVWINGGAVPSSEADGRAFSFDILPSSQIESMIIAKSPAPENPADVAGGFIKITTKNMPESNSMQLGISTGFNTVTHGTDFRLNPGSSTDFLGFDLNKRPLSKDFPSHLNTAQSRLTELTKTGFNNDWSIRTINPMPDIRMSLAVNRRYQTKGGIDIGMVSALGYSHTYKTMRAIENTRYGAFAAGVERPEATEDYEDDQYVVESKINAMHNMSFRLNERNTIDFRNLFNLSGKNRLTERTGISSNSGVYYIDQTEMLYTSRLSYTGQLAGNHILNQSRGSILDWNIGYSYANKQEPDRRIIKNMAGYTEGQSTADIKTYNDKIERHFQSLSDNIASAALDYKRILGSNDSFKPELKAGLFGTFRTRDYTPREFVYRYNNLSVEERSDYIYLPFEQMLDPKYLGADKVYIDENTKKYNAYSADDIQGAGYAALNIPLGKFNAYIGARYEYALMTLTYDKSMSASSSRVVSKEYKDGFLLPSANLSYNFSDKHIVRASYGKTINRPEFREVSPAVYYDFDLMGEVQGNVELKSAQVHNFDLRYEFYPAAGEVISLGLFYKSFKNPIEWNFVDMGGSYRYSFDNANSATNLGVELDIRKSLAFVGAKNLTLVLNATFVKSNVKFNGSDINQERDRAMQGQSPYIINTGLYYNSPKLGLNASVLYNRIGKRIIGIGKSNSVNGSTDSDIPDSYEMPRNMLDLMIGKRLGKMFEVKISAKDLLADNIVYKQFPTRENNGRTEKISQETKVCNAGRSFSVALNINF